MENQPLEPIFDGRRLRAVRKNRGLSAENLARRANITVRHIWRLEADQRPNTSAVTLARVALALGTTVEYIVHITDDPRGIHELTASALDVQELDNENRPTVV